MARCCQVFADLYAVIAWMFETIRCRVDPKEAETDAAECEAATEDFLMSISSPVSQLGEAAVLL